MHKSFVGFVLAAAVFMGSNANATSYMKFIVNGDSSHTMTQGDTLGFRCDCGVGDSILFQYYLDLNSNHSIDGSDMFLASWYSRDGDTVMMYGSADDNPVPDGIFNSRALRDGSAPEDYCVRATDESSTSAVGYLHVDAIPTPVSTVSGTVTIEGFTAPNDTLAYMMIGGFKATPPMESWSAFTDNMGDYTINFGSSGDTYHIGTFMSTPPGYTMEGETTLVVTGNITGIDFHFAVAVEESKLVNRTTMTVTPNLVSNLATINYTLSNEASVSLKIYDITGKEVSTLMNEKQTAGKHETSFNTNSLASGIYFVTLQTPTNKQTRKLVLTK